MKFIIIAVTLIASLCNGQFIEPEKNLLLDPGFLTNTSWSHQIAYHELQDDIDQAFVEINKVVASSLAVASKSGLLKYQVHTEEVLEVYDPAFDGINTLNPSDCKNIAVSLLQNSVSYGGFGSANCFRDYNGAIQSEANKLNAILKGFSGDYGQVVLNVYRSYVGNNAMVDSELIEHNINSTFAQIVRNWSSSRPVVDELKAAFDSSIQSSSVALGTCFQTYYTNTNAIVSVVLSQVESCRSFDLSANTNSRANRASRNVEWKDYTPEFNALIASF